MRAGRLHEQAISLERRFGRHFPDAAVTLQRPPRVAGQVADPTEPRVLQRPHRGPEILELGDVGLRQLGLDRLLQAGFGRRHDLGARRGQHARQPAHLRRRPGRRTMHAARPGADP